MLGAVACSAASPKVRREGQGDPVVESVLARTRAFLDSYARNDMMGVEGMIDPEGVSVYGSDVAEYVVGAAALRQLMADDFALWRSARFGAPTRMSVRATDALATVIFDVPFSAGGRPPLLVRVTMVWRADRGQWWLTQSSNVVPTVGSAAHQLVTAP